MSKYQGVPGFNLFRFNVPYIYSRCSKYNPYQKHINNFSEYKCSKPKISNYVDDIFCVLRSNKNELWKDIESYIKKMNKYLNDNKLINNVSKTKNNDN